MTICVSFTLTRSKRKVTRMCDNGLSDATVRAIANSGTRNLEELDLSFGHVHPPRPHTISDDARQALAAALPELEFRPRGVAL